MGTDGMIANRNDHEREKENGSFVTLTYSKTLIDMREMGIDFDVPSSGILVLPTRECAPANMP